MLASPAYAQFDPNAGADSATTSSYKPRKPLPSTAPLTAEPQQKIIFAPTAAAAAPMPLANVAPAPILSPLAAAAAPLAGDNRPVIAPVAVAAAPVAVSPAPQFPAVDPAVAAEAQRELNAQPAPSYIAPVPNFTAPTPLPAQTAVVATPVVAAPVAVAPVVAAPVVAATVPIVAVPVDQGLSPASKSILHKLPPKLDTTKAPVGGKLDVSRMSPAVKAIAEPEKVQSYDAVGLSIKVAKPGIDTNYELNQAYTALMGGDTETAISKYKLILTDDPTNQDALFGLAATYHRNGDIEKARPYYGQLLKVNPNHREGLNNFLALISDESPNEAVAELGRLEQKNPDFSPIPAQEATVFMKLGYPDQAREKLLRAIELAPENMTYKYNLAVLLDRQGDYADAGGLYRLLIEASMNGEKLPATTDTLQKRLNYITSAASAPKPVPVAD